MPDFGVIRMHKNCLAGHTQSISDPAGFWSEQARRIDWETPFTGTWPNSAMRRP